MVVRRASRDSCSAMLTLNITVLSTSAIGPLAFEGSKLIMSHCRSVELDHAENAAFISTQHFLYTLNTRICHWKTSYPPPPTKTLHCFLFFSLLLSR